MEQRMHHCHVPRLEYKGKAELISNMVGAIVSRLVCIYVGATKFYLFFGDLSGIYWSGICLSKFRLRFNTYLVPTFLVIHGQPSTPNLLHLETSKAFD
jgi:hypothetical protein